jgi:glycosyltransferase involved in cell wall biosynthesis
MACGLPVVTTDVGGNAEVVCSPALGVVIPFGDHVGLASSIRGALARTWDREAILAYARRNSWDDRAAALVEEFTAVSRCRGAALSGTEREA